MSSLATTAPAGVFKKITLRETAVLLALAWLIPFAVHLLPWGGARPLGAYLVPVFWATFVAVYFYGAAAGLLVGLFSPAVNLLVTGLPAGKFLGTMSLELLVFVLAVTLAVRSAPRFWLWAPLGYGVAKTVVALVLSTSAVAGNLAAPGRFLVATVTGGAAGLVVLTVLNFALIRYYPKDARPAP